MTKHTAATPSTSRVGKPTSKLRVISLSMYMYSDWIQKCFSEIACAIGGRRTELLSNPGWIKESELASFATHEKAKRGRYICYLKVECGRGPSGTQVHCCSTHTLFVLCCFVLFCFSFSLFSFVLDVMAPVTLLFALPDRTPDRSQRRWPCILILIVVAARIPRLLMTCGRRRKASIHY